MPGATYERRVPRRALRGGWWRWKAPPAPARPVLQYIGTLDQPAWIGIADSGQRWTTLRLQDEQVRFSEIGRAFSYGELAAHPALKARADRLVETWERERWLNRPQR